MTDHPAAPVPDQAVTANPDPVREAAFVQFWGHVGPWIASGHPDPEDVAHEAYCAGWEAAAPAIREAERQRLTEQFPPMIINVSGEITAGLVAELKAKWLAAREAARGQPAVRLHHDLTEPQPDGTIRRTQWDEYQDGTRGPETVTTVPATTPPAAPAGTGATASGGGTGGARA